ncbi:MAG: Bifunctional protein HldE [Lentisphaerae bacterium ADurb.BinA184]|nr:MAG: Bifunctional protein HldE [Lentisphaerae bacterium ADurb.BinA184]
MDVQTFAPLTPPRLEEILTRIPQARVAVIGDFCLDIYWFLDTSRSEPSLETGLSTQPVREQRYSLGGAGNVVSNLVALGCRHVHALGVFGDDPWGREQMRLLEALGVNTAGMAWQSEDWATLAYGKPHAGREERSRLDFGNFNVLSAAAADALLGHARRLLPALDVVLVNQQVPQGIHSPRLQAGLGALIREFPRTRFIVDSRHCTDAYAGALLKLNEHEAARLCNLGREHSPLLVREDALAAADQLFERHGRPVILTRGRRGLLVRDTDGMCEIAGLQTLGPIDTVGAGDSVLAGLGLGLAAGATPVEAAQLGNFVAGVTIQKLNQTGTATPDEVRALARNGDYVYHPELAEDPRRARRHPNTEFEVVTALPAHCRITAAIFDHDGTLSTLRQGWEAVMEPVMIRAVLGPRYPSADESLYHQVVTRVRAYIDETTGIQTLSQMQGLVQMVREFGCVPAEQILDAIGYKRLYNEALMGLVRERLAKLGRGELAVEDFTIKNALPFLRRLHAVGIPLYLVSGTDQEDVAAEARAMGYAGLFTGGIHGAVNDVSREAKRLVLDRLLGEIGADGARGLITFGDGPVELRETRRRGGYAIGLATDEVRRFGLNPAKRTRLIRAGADLVIPDFSQIGPLLGLLGLPA